MLSKVRHGSICDNKSAYGGIRSQMYAALAACGFFYHELTTSLPRDYHEIITSLYSKLTTSALRAYHELTTRHLHARAYHELATRIITTLPRDYHECTTSAPSVGRTTNLPRACHEITTRLLRDYQSFGIYSLECPLSLPM